MKKLRFSRYTHIVENDKYFLISNDLNKSIVAIEKSMKRGIDLLLNDQIAADGNLKHTIAELYMKGFLIKDSITAEEEKENCLEIWRTSQSEIGTVYFMPTLNCNFRCTYCFIGTAVGNYDKGYMSDDIIEQAANFIIEKAVELNKKELRVVLFGGEPLVAIKQNNLFMEKINQYKVEGINIVFLLVTNGYAITEPVIDQFIELGLGQVQITIDGPKAIHDVRRYNSKKESTFDRIIDNLLLLKNKKVTIALRINVDQDNYDYVEELLEYFNEIGLSERIIVQFAPVDPSDFSDYNGYITKVLEKYDQFYLKADQLHIKYTSWQRCCSLKDNYFFAIAPTGELYKCPIFVGEEKTVIGTVYEGFNSKYYEYLNPSIRDRCENCKYLLLCNGGCEPMRRKENLEEFCFKEANSMIEKSFLKNKFNSDYELIARERIGSSITKFY